MLEVFALHQDQQSNFQSTLESHFLLISTKSTYATIGKFYQNITVFSWHPMRFWSANTIFELVIDFRVPGTSLRTGKSGLIPSLYATPIESPPVAFSIYYVGTTSVSHHRGESLIIESLIMNHFLWLIDHDSYVIMTDHSGGNVLWPGVQKVLEQKKRPIQMTILITNDGIRLVQMSQIRKREFVQTDHVSCFKLGSYNWVKNYCE